MASTRLKNFWLLIIACFFCLNSPAQSGDHYCSNGYELELDLTARSHQDERLIASASDGRTLTKQQCNWRLTFKGLPSPRQVLLQSLSIDNETWNSELYYQLNQSPTNEAITCKEESWSSRQSVHAGMFLVLTVTDSRTYQSVSAFSKSTQDSETSTAAPATLRAMTPLPGFCSRDMLSFRGSCYAVSSIRQSAPAAMSSIGGLAQMASFSNMSEISDFIAANNARRAVYPYNRPLELTEPVRIGLFYRAASDEVLRLFRNETECQLMPFRTPEAFVEKSATSRCGSLTIDSSGKAAITFDSCSKPMLTLISFPQNPGSSHRSCKQCVKQVLTLINTYKKLVEENDLQPTWIVPLIFAILVAIALIGGAIAFHESRRACNKRRLSFSLPVNTGAVTSPHQEQRNLLSDTASV